MDEIDEFLAFRKDILKDAADEEGFIQASEILLRVTPSMLDAKLVDTEDPNHAYYESDSPNAKLDAYSINESGERLQLYIIDDDTLSENADNDSLLVSVRANYEKQFNRAATLIKEIYLGKSEHQFSSPLLPLVSKLTSVEGVEQFDVVEIFLVSLTATVERPGGVVRPKSIHFAESALPITITHGGQKIKKEILVMRKLIDLNFLFNVEIAKGNREPLLVDFSKTFGEGLHAIQAAKEEMFESYLCVLPADLLVELYKRYSTRLLEKNVRSFLQFRGVNAGIKKTIKDEAYKFIAYNNGLTITATEGKVRNKRGQFYIQSLTDFQIVNGGQTTASIYFSKKEGLDVSKVKVMAKINLAKNLKDRELDELIGNISEYSNAQSRVSKVDLRSRNPQLVKLKQLSESVTTPTGENWFFERAKGEYQTQVRIKGRNKKIITKKYPPKRRFTKELLAKYYIAWGDTPYLVKKGGEKVFRYFLEELSGDPDEDIEPLIVDREFYENLISRIIIFRGMESIHGTRAKALGQLRAAVIPYSISVLYEQTDGLVDGRGFNFGIIWQKQSLPDDLAAFFEELMKLMYEVFRKYSLSDDVSEYTKKKELWDAIDNCSEVVNFVQKPTNATLIAKYTITT
jgi:hypothetical protein